jgi:hypothetical protein
MTCQQIHWNRKQLKGKAHEAAEERAESQADAGPLEP